MWIPKSEDEVQAIIGSGDVEESATLDFKEEVSKSGKEIAKDVAAMSTDGGVIIYGIGEEKGQPIKLTPVPLERQPERIQNIVSAGIQEPPTIRISVIRTETDPSTGYLIVEVPTSPRAPHMVQVKGDNRYYGRSSTGNRLLTEGDVARLYERRQRWDRDANALLDAVIAKAPFEAESKYGYIHLVAEPVVMDDRILERALGKPKDQSRALSELSSRARRIKGWNGDSYPSFYPSGNRRTADGWLVFMDNEPQSSRTPERTLDAYFSYEGQIRLFCGRTAESTENLQLSGGMKSCLLVFEEHIADWVFRFLYLVGQFYKEAGYLGAIDLGIALTGLEGAQSDWARTNARFFTSVKLPDQYRKTIRRLAMELDGDRLNQIANDLVERFFLATTNGGYSPFTESEPS